MKTEAPPVAEAEAEAPVSRRDLPMVVQDFLATLPDEMVLVDVAEDGALTLRISSADVVRLAPRAHSTAWLYR